MAKHYIPRKYLEGFTRDPERKCIWMYDMRRRRWAFAAISQVAAKADYFDQETEDRLSKEVEKSGHIVLQKLRNRLAITAEERKFLALYVAVMLKRVPRRRRKAQELMPSVLDRTIAETEQKLRRIAERTGLHTRCEQLISQLPSVREKLIKEPPRSVVDQINSPWPTDRITEAILRMAWRVVPVKSEYSRYITTDNPAFFFLRTMDSLIRYRSLPSRYRPISSCLPHTKGSHAACSSKGGAKKLPEKLTDAWRP